MEGHKWKYNNFPVYIRTCQKCGYKNSGFIIANTKGKETVDVDWFPVKVTCEEYIMNESLE